jgi:RNA polymerase sigma-70 factor, ECF subfamily
MQIMAPSIGNNSEIQHLLLSGFAARAVRQKARQLVRQREFAESEREDLEQELRLHLFSRQSKFDPTIAHWNVFVRTLVERHVATLVKQRRAKTRNSQRLTDREDRRRILTDLVLDTAAILSQMPRHDQKLCQRLQQDSATEVARQLGISPNTLRYRISRLRHWFRTPEKNISKNLSWFSLRGQ